MSALNFTSPRDSLMSFPISMVACFANLSTFLRIKSAAFATIAALSLYDFFFQVLKHRAAVATFFSNCSSVSSSNVLTVFPVAGFTLVYAIVQVLSKFRNK